MAKKYKETIKVSVPNLAFATMVHLTNLFSTGSVEQRVTENNEIEFTFQGIPKDEFDEMFNQSLIPVTVDL